MRIMFLGGGLLLLMATACLDTSSDALSGKELARIHCGSCHQFPNPDLLPREKWENVLPAMGARLGMPSETYDPYSDKTMEVRFKLEAARIFPAEPVLSQHDWKAIKEYFLQNAPEKLKLPEEREWEASPQFATRLPALPLYGPPAITMVDYVGHTNAFYLADRNGSFGKLSADLELAYQIRLPRPIVEVEHIQKDRMGLLTIGQLYPDEANAGAMVQMDESRISQQDFLFGQLPRPVHFLATDLDQDENEDYVVCSFGNQIGRFSWFERNGSSFTETIIKEGPGTTRVFAEDLDQDGDQDLIALFAQGDEGISVFYNQEGKLKEERVLRFPPVFGSNDFEYLDFDGDGHKDIILTNGDNGDYSNVLKPYHGVRIYLNDGTRHFEEKYFFPFYGAAKVRCRDFDLDGDLDLFVMSFFPDFDISGQNSLVYLENQGEWHFQPYRIPHADAGRWMVMDAGDLDQDGDEDLVLGSFTLNSTGVADSLIRRWETSNQKILVLENQQVP